MTSPANIEQVAQVLAPKRLGYFRIRLAGLLIVAGTVVLVAGAFSTPHLSGTAATPDQAAGLPGVSQRAPEAGYGAPPASWQRMPVGADGLVERLGVRIVQVASSGGGGLLDLRYQVVDADKAAALHDPATPPALVDEGTGLVANDLLMGHAHTEAFKAGVTYYFVFENPGNLVQQGSKVSVLLGDVQIEHIDVK